MNRWVLMPLLAGLGSVCLPAEIVEDLPPADWVNISDYTVNRGLGGPGQSAPYNDDTGGFRDAVSVASGGTLFLPRGRYEISGAIDLNNVHLRGTRIPNTEFPTDGSPWWGTEIVVENWQAGSSIFTLTGTRCFIEDIVLVVDAENMEDVSWFGVTSSETAPRDVEFDSISARGAMGSFLQVVGIGGLPAHTAFNIWNCDIEAASGTLLLGSSMGPLEVIDSDLRSVADPGEDTSGVLCDATDGCICDLRLSGVVFDGFTEGISALGPSAGSSTIEAIVTSCIFNCERGISVTAPAAMHLNLANSHFETDAEAVLFDDSTGDFPTTGSVVIRGNSFVQRDTLSGGNTIALRNLDCPISITANHFAQEHDPTLRTEPMIEVIGVKQSGSVVVSSNIFPEINEGSDEAPAIRLVDCQGAVISANAIPGNTTDQSAVEIVDTTPAADLDANHVAITGNLLAGYGIRYPVGVGGALNVLGDETNNLFLGPVPRPEPLFVANTGAQQLLVVDPSNQQTVEEIYASFSTGAGSLPTHVAVTPFVEAGRPRYILVSDEGDESEIIDREGNLYVYEVIEAQGTINVRLVDADTSTPQPDSFILSRVAGQWTHPRGIEAFVDNVSGTTNPDGFRIYIACAGNLHGGDVNDFSSNYTVDQDTRGVVEVIFNPDLEVYGSEPFFINRAFEMPDYTTDDADQWPYNLAVPEDVALSANGDRMAVSTTTPEGETFLAQVFLYDITGEYPAVDRSPLRVIYHMGDEMSEIAYSSLLTEGTTGDPMIWSSGFQSSSALIREIADSAPTEPFIDSIPLVGSTPITVRALAVESEGGGEAGYYAVTDSTGSTNCLVRFGVDTSGPVAMLSVANETTYGVMLPLDVETASGYVAEEIATFGAPPSDVTIIDRSPFTGGRAAVVPTPEGGGRLEFIHLDVVDNPVDSVTVDGALNDPQGVTGF